MSAFDILADEALRPHLEKVADKNMDSKNIEALDDLVSRNLSMDTTVDFSAMHIRSLLTTYLKLLYR